MHIVVPDDALSSSHTRLAISAESTLALVYDEAGSLIVIVIDSGKKVTTATRADHDFLDYAKMVGADLRRKDVKCKRR